MFESASVRVPRGDVRLEPVADGAVDVRWGSPAHDCMVDPGRGKNRVWSIFVGVLSLSLGSLLFQVNGKSCCGVRVQLRSTFLTFYLLISAVESVCHPPLAHSPTIEQTRDTSPSGTDVSQVSKENHTGLEDTDICKFWISQPYGGRGRWSADNMPHIHW